MGGGGGGRGIGGGWGDGNRSLVVTYEARGK